MAKLGTVQVAGNRGGLVRKAQELYAKWNSDKAKTAVGVRITMKSIY